MDIYGQIFRDFISDFKGCRSYSRDFTSDFKAFQSDFKNLARISRIPGTLKIVGISGISRISGWIYACDFRDFRSAFRTFVHVYKRLKTNSRRSWPLGELLALPPPKKKAILTIYRAGNSLSSTRAQSVSFPSEVTIALEVQCST